MKQIIKVVTILITVILTLFITAELLSYGALCKLNEEAIFSVADNEAQANEFIDSTSSAGSVKTIFVIVFLFLASFTIILGLNWNDGRFIITSKYMLVSIIFPGIILSILGFILKVGVDFDNIVVNEGASAITIIMTKLSSLIVSGILTTGLITFAIGTILLAALIIINTLLYKAKR